MPTGFNQLLKLGFLRDKIGLQKKNVPATAVSVARGATETWALGKNVSLRPKTTLPNNDLHALKPARHGGVVFREIKQLVFAV
jgi:hypothetical protein